MLFIPPGGQPTEIQKFLSTYSSMISGNNGISEKFDIGITTEMLDISENDDVSELIFIYNGNKNKGKQRCIEDEANKLILSFDGAMISKTFPKIHGIDEQYYINDMLWESSEIEPWFDGTHVSVFKHNKMFFIRAWHNDQVLGDVRANEVKSFLSNKHSPWFAPFNANNIGDSCCWTFEFISPKFKNIVEHKESELYLLAMFNKNHAFECSKEFTDTFAEKNGFKRPVRTKVKNLGQVLGLLNSMTTLNKGFIISDNNKHRVKAINPVYKIIDDMKNLKNKPSVENLAKLVMLGYQNEVISICDEYSIVIKLIEQSLKSLLSEASILWTMAASAKSRKEFADKIAAKRPISRLLFECYKYKTPFSMEFDYAKYIKPKHIIDRAKTMNIQKFYSAVSDAEIDRESKISKANK